jgi:hypothetical protein
MPNDGVVKSEQLKISEVPEQKDATYTVESKTTPTETPTYESVKVTPGDVKEIKVTPTGKDGKPTGEKSQVVQVPDSSKVTDVKFEKPIQSDKITVAFVSKSGKPSDSKVISVVGCLPVPGTIKFQISFD